MSLLWWVFLANGAVLLLALLLLAFTPIEIHAPIEIDQLALLFAGFVVLVGLDFVLLRRVLAPLFRLTEVMSSVDPDRPGRRLSGVDPRSAEGQAMARAFNSMLDRLENARHEAARTALAAQEAERLRVARELHDEIGQTLTAVTIQAERAADGDPAQAPQALRGVADAVRESLDEVRRIARELRPEALDDLGLVNALIALSTRVGAQEGPRVKRELQAELPPLSAEVELVLYRIAQESLTNALRHSDADSVTVSLERRREQRDARRGRRREGHAGGAPARYGGDRRHARAGAPCRRPAHDRLATRSGHRGAADDPGGTRGSMTTPLKTRILLADDHEVVRNGLKMVLDSAPDLEVVAEAGDGAEAVELALSEDIHLAVLDVTMPRMTGLQAARELSRRKPELRVLILSMHDNEQYFFEALKAGASGYVLKSVANRDLIEACRATMRGEPFLYPAAVRALVKDYLDRASRGETTPEDPLSPRELEVVKLIAEGMTSEEIAEQLFISKKTVDRHRANVLEKLGMRNRVELTRYAIRRGLVVP